MPRSVKNGSIETAGGGFLYVTQQQVYARVTGVNSISVIGQWDDWEWIYGFEVRVNGAVVDSYATQRDESLGHPRIKLEAIDSSIKVWMAEPGTSTWYLIINVTNSSNLQAGDWYSAGAGGVETAFTSLDPTGHPVKAFDFRVQSDGSIKDVVSGGLAQIARLGPKYVLKSDLGTNYVLHSSFEVDSNSDGLADAITSTSAAGATITETRQLSRDFVVDGNYSQRLTVSDVSVAPSDALYRVNFPTTAVGSFAPGESLVASIYIRGTWSGISNAQVACAAYTSASGYITEVAGSVLTTAPSNGWVRISATFQNLPANTSRVNMRVYLNGVGVGDSFDIYLDAAQIEKVSLGVTSPSTYNPTSASPIVNSDRFVAFEGSAANHFRNTELVDVITPIGTPDGGYSYQTASIAGTPTWTIGRDDGNYIRAQYTGQAGDVSGVLDWYQDSVLTSANLTQGDRLIFSVEIRGSLSGCTTSLDIQVKDAANANIARTKTAQTITRQWARYSVVVDVPAGPNRVLAAAWVEGLGSGDTCDVYWRRPQIEKVPAGVSIPSSYIINTSTVTGTSASRNGTLAPEKYPSGPGLWALVEEARTNLLLTSSFSIDSNSDGYADNWSLLGGVTLGTKSTTRVIGGGLYGDSQRLQVSNVTGGSGMTYGIYQRYSPGTLAATQVYTFSLWAKGTVSAGVTAMAEIYCRDASATGSLATVSIAFTGLSSTTWKRYTGTVTAPIGTTYVDARAGMYVIDVGDSGDIEFCCMQLEAAATASSYIHTTTTATTRPVDSITYPLASLGTRDANGGETVFGVAGLKWSQSSPNRTIAQFKYTGSLANIITLRAGSGAQTIGAGFSDGSGSALALTVATGSPADYTPLVAAARRSVRALNVFRAGVKSSDGSLVVDVSAFGSDIFLGNDYAGSTSANGWIHRIVVYESALSDSDISTISASLLLGTPVSRVANIINIKSGKETFAWQ